MNKLLSRRGGAVDEASPNEPRCESSAPPVEPATVVLPPPSHKRKNSDALESCAANLDLAAAAAPSPLEPGSAADAEEDHTRCGGVRRQLFSPCRLATLAMMLMALTTLHALRSRSGEEEVGDPMAVAPRIIGGRASTDGEQSYMVSLQDSMGHHFCGGTLVSKDCVLTAAHCTSHHTGLDQITAVVGRTRLSNYRAGEEIGVSFQKTHPLYDPGAGGTQRSDFALLFLQRPTVTRAKVVELNRAAELPLAGKLVAVAGWGDTDASEDVRTAADTLQVANLRTMSNEQCDDSSGLYGTYSLSYRGYIHDDMMCASSKKRDSCQGDSGGPLMYRGKQVGITSWGLGCNNAEFPGVYARVSSAYEWIERNVCRRSMYPDSQFGCEPW